MGSVDCMNKTDSIVSGCNQYENISNSDTILKLPLPYNIKDDIKNINWGEYLQHFSNIASNVHSYHNELNQALSDIDLQLCDIMHYIELYNLSEEDSIRIMKLFKACREQRRDIKDEMYRVECFQKSIGTSSNISKAKASIKQIGKLSTRIYHPRKLQELFKDCPEKTVRKSEIMQYSKQETIFDGKENDWKQFARQQAEFYDNVEQYIYNLQSDLHEIDNEIEQTLEEIEDSNYNVTQGYKVYKHLKELRNKKKERQKELDCLRILTVKLDCSMMAESMRSCVNEIEEVMKGV